MLMPALLVLFQVVLIDITLAGDNAVVVGLAVAGLAPPQRNGALAAGLGLATLVRVGLSLVALRLLAVVGLTLAGGVLLLFVGWKMWRELATPAADATAASPARKTMAQAIGQILLADLSMSLDNVLAVAGAARGHVGILAAGLALSVLLMGFAATLLARLLQRYRWISWVGLAIISYVALSMIWQGWAQLAPHLKLP